MMHLRTALVLGGLLLLPAIALGARPDPCPGVLMPGGECPADVGATLATCCPCDDFRNHGQYVRCNAHAVNALRKAGCLDKEQRRTLKRCAARSTCSKPEGFVTCCKQKPGSCQDGTCAKTDPAVECLVDEDCPTNPRCSIKRDAERCEAQGGIPGTGSCCASCVSIEATSD